MLAEDAISINHNVEDTTGSFDQFGDDAGFGLDGFRQTGGTGFIVSLPAIGDRDVHFVSLSVIWDCDLE